MNPSREARARIAYVDGLRAIAVLAVVVHHVVKTTYSGASGLLERVLVQGHHGVELFFVISGFCLSYPLLQKTHRTGVASFDLIRFGAKRIVRIVPPYYAAILVFVLIGLQRVPPGDVLRQSLFMDLGTRWLSPPFWSLAVEFRWYFLFPLVLLLWVRSPRTYLCLVAGLFALQETRAVSTDLTALPAFMLGIVAADLAMRRDRRAWIALPLTVLAAAIAFLQMPATDAGRDASAVWEIAAFLFVVAAGAVPLLQRALSVRPVVFIGVASYSIYLCHQLGIDYAQRWGYAPWIATAAGIGVGIAFWAVAERPFTDTPLREKLVAAFESVLGKWFAFAAVPEQLALARKIAHPVRTLARRAPAVVPTLDLREEPLQAQYR